MQKHSHDLAIETNVSLGPLTTFRLPGVAKRLVRVRTPEELVAAAKLAERDQLPLKVISGGSNIVLSNQPLAGLIAVYRAGRPRAKELIIRDQRLYAAGSVWLKDLVILSVKHGLSGLESLAGIPGTVGGAIVGNAGAYGRAIGEVVEKVLVYNGQKKCWLSKSDCRFGYRDSLFKQRPWLVLAARFRLAIGERPKLQSVVRRIKRERNKKYGPGFLCPGSYFKNVLIRAVAKPSLALIDPRAVRDGKIPAGWLLEQVGAKGICQGGIRVANHHGNLLLNDGTGTFKDLKKLVARLKSRVVKKFGIALEEEVRYMI